MQVNAIVNGNICIHVGWSCWNHTIQLSSLCQDAKRFGNQALQFLPQLGSRGNANGTAAALHLTLALLGGHRRWLWRWKPEWRTSCGMIIHCYYSLSFCMIYDSLMTIEICSSSSCNSCSGLWTWHEKSLPTSLGISQCEFPHIFSRLVCFQHCKFMYKSDHKLNLLIQNPSYTCHKQLGSNGI